MLYVAGAAMGSVYKLTHLSLHLYSKCLKSTLSILCVSIRNENLFGSKLSTETL